MNRLLPLPGLFLALSCAAVANDQDSDLEHIVVKGQKLDQSLQNTPASISLMTGEEIAREPVVDLYDLINRIPNVSSAFGEQGFSIRGIDQRGTGGSGQTLTVYVDDAPLGNFTTFFGPMSAWDLGQVEVYRGPQSTNFGRNALAGAIYLRTRDPSYEPDLRLRVEGGEYGYYWLAAAGGGAVVDEKVAVRFAAEQRESDGYIDNTFLNTDADAFEYTSGRVKFLIEPSDTLRILTTTAYAENFAGEDGLPLDDAFDREVAYDTPGEEGTETFQQTVNIQWQINDRLSLESITAYQDTDYLRQEDFDSTPAPIGALDREGVDEALSQELRLKLTTERLKAALGLYYLDTEEVYDDSFTVPVTIVNPMLPLSNLVTRTSTLTNEAENFAVFLDGEYELNPSFDLLFGARYDEEEQESIAIAETDILGFLPPPFDVLLAGVEGTSRENPKTEFDAFLPKLGLRWNMTDRANLAFVVQRAYRAGGAEISSLDGSVNEYDPEYLWNYELSARTRWLDDRLRWNTNIYYSNWEDQQVSVPLSETVTNLFKTVNAGESTLYGLETEVNYMLTPALTVYAGLGYANTEFDDFVNADPAPGEPDNFAGNEFPLAPELSYNIGFDYDSGNGLFGGVDINYQDDAYTDQENREGNEIDGRTLVNARVGYAFGAHTRVSLFARNLFDEKYFVFRDQPSFARVGAPRLVGARVDLTF